MYVPPYRIYGHYEDVIDLLRISLGSIIETFGNEPVIVGGDFNGRIGRFNDPIPELLIENSVLFSVRECSDNVSEKEGRSLVGMMSEIGMFLLNGRTPGDCHSI